MEFSYLFRALWRRKWILLICVVASSLLAFVFTRNGKKEYQSSAQIATRFTVSDQPNGSVNYIQSEFEFGNVIEMITSPNVVSLVSYHLLMHDLQSPEPFTTLNARQQQLAGTIDKKLQELGITLQEPKAPIANYVPFVRSGNLLTVSGQVCLDFDGKSAIGLTSSPAIVVRLRPAAFAVRPHVGPSVQYFPTPAERRVVDQ